MQGSSSDFESASLLQAGRHLQGQKSWPGGRHSPSALLKIPAMSQYHV
jgi:hypothetical protein